MSEHVIDRDGLVWRVVRDGGMATRADYAGVTSIGIDTLRRDHGPLVSVEALTDLAAHADRLTVTHERTCSFVVQPYHCACDCDHHVISAALDRVRAREEAR